MRTVHSKDISVRQIKRVFRRYGLFRKKHYSDLSHVVDFIQNEISMAGQMHGYRWLHSKCILHGLSVPRETVRVILGMLDPDGVDIRSRRRLRRRQYSAKGPNYLWHVDGYDKLKPYGIGIHGCIDGFSRKIVWLEANSTNNDPYIIAGYFLRAIWELGGYPYRVRSDLGTENGNMEVIQRALRREADACYLYGPSNHNQRIESWWGLLRKECVQFWINCFEQLKDDGHFRGTWFEKDLMRLCFLRLIQVNIYKY